MSYRPPGRQKRYTIYRADRGRRSRYRRRRLIAVVVSLLAIALIAGTAWALTSDGDGGVGGPATAGAGDGGATQGVEAQGGGTNGGGTTRAAARDSASPDPSASTSAGASPSASSPSPSPSPSASLARKVITIGWVGDTTPGSRYGLPPNGGRALFASMAPYLRKPDLMIANVEGTYSTATTSKGSGPNTFSFQAPPSYAKALTWAGIDLVNLANNHTNDYLALGLQQTKAALRAVEVPFAGIPGTVPVVEVKGVRVAALGFSPYPWNNDINNIAKAKKLVAAAAKKADLVVVLIHAGAEGANLIHVPSGSEFAYGENRGNSRAFAHAAIDSGADLVLGSGPHVIRGIERYKKRLIAYSLGNFGGWGNFGTGGNLSLSGLLTVKIDGTGAIRGGRWLSVYINHPGVPTPDSRHTAARLVRQLSAQDFRQTYRLRADGTFAGD